MTAWGGGGTGRERGGGGAIVGMLAGFVATTDTRGTATTSGWSPGTPAPTGIGVLRRARSRAHLDFASSHALIR
jgi:hypothetical protein